MTFKPFFVHEYHNPGKLPNRLPRGFTVFVCHDSHVKGNVLVHTAWCKTKDEFNKKKGRETALNSWPVSISPKLVPQHMLHCVKNLGWDWRTESDYYYLFKKML